MRLFTLLLFSFLAALPLRAQSFQFREDSGENAPDRSIVFAQYPDRILGMDVYMPEDSLETHPCILYTYGGGFKLNFQREAGTCAFCRRLADEAGFIVLAIDYRLGLKENRNTSRLGMVKPLYQAVQMGTEDLFKALSCILENASSLRIDPARIVLCGSSAGAMISLQADYELCNRTPMTALVPDTFRFAGVVAFAGALYSASGFPKYTLHRPAPTFLLHGTEDKLVPYGRISAIKYYLAGSDALARIFRENGSIYRIRRYDGLGHSVASRMQQEFDPMVRFIREVAFGGERICVDETIRLLDIPVETAKFDRIDLDYLYKEIK